MCELKRGITFFLIGVATLFFQPLTQAAQADVGIEFQNDPASLTILFVNGVKNDKLEAADSSESLITALHSKGLPYSKYNIHYFHNLTDGPLDDLWEVKVQIEKSDVFRGLAQGNKENYYKLLGQHYSDQISNAANLPTSERRVIGVTAALVRQMEMDLAVSPGLVVVPHSQGNLYVEAAYAVLLAKGRTDLTSKIRVVGVAPASATTPSDRYITSNNDKVVTEKLNSAALALNLIYYSSLPANVAPCTIDPLRCGDQIDWSKIDSDGHSFAGVYLNDSLKKLGAETTFPGILYNFVNTSLEELGASSSQILYKQEFDSNPFWETDQSDNFFWSSVKQTYVSRTYTGSPPTRPNRYSSIRLPTFDPNRGFTLTWDQRLLSVTGNGTVYFGLMSDDRLVMASRYSGLPYLIPESTIAIGVGRLGTIYEFNMASIYVAGGQAQGSVGDFSLSGANEPTFTLGTWYRHTVRYSPEPGQVTITTVNRATGAFMPYYNSSIQVPANAFSQNMQWLGVANDAIGYTPFGFGTQPTDFVDAEFDNVLLTYN